MAPRARKLGVLDLGVDQGLHEFVVGQVGIDHPDFGLGVSTMPAASPAAKKAGCEID